MSVAIYLVLAAVAGVALVSTLRGQSKSRRYLEEGEGAPLEVSHLPPALQKVAHTTRALRISLEGPRRELLRPGETIAGDRLGLQARLREASREVGEWVLMIDRLGPEDLEAIHDLGGRPERVRGLFEAQEWSLELASGRKTLVGRLDDLRTELSALETKLQGQHDPYR